MTAMVACYQLMVREKLFCNRHACKLVQHASDENIYLSNSIIKIIGMEEGPLKVT